MTKLASSAPQASAAMLHRPDVNRARRRSWNTARPAARGTQTLLSRLGDCLAFVLARLSAIRSDGQAQGSKFEPQRHRALDRMEYGQTQQELYTVKSAFMLVPVSIIALALVTGAALVLLAPAALRAVAFEKTSPHSTGHRELSNNSFEGPVVRDGVHYKSVKESLNNPSVPQLAVEYHHVFEKKRPFRRARQNFLTFSRSTSYVPHADPQAIAEMSMRLLFHAHHTQRVRHASNPSLSRFVEKMRSENHTEQTSTLANSNSSSDSPTVHDSVGVVDATILPKVDMENSTAAFASIASNSVIHEVVVSALVTKFSLPQHVAQILPTGQAYELLWKLYYMEALRPEIPARALFVHVRNGLANRLRALAGGVALAKVIGRVPVVVWDQDPHLSACYDDLFVGDRLSTNTNPSIGSYLSLANSDDSYTKTVRTIGVTAMDDILTQYSDVVLDRHSEALLYRNFIVLDKFLPWIEIAEWSPAWSPVNQMEKETVEKQSFVGFTQSTDVADIPKHTASINHHVYVKTAYVVRTKPAPLVFSEDINPLLRRLVPAPPVQAIVNKNLLPDIHEAVGVHIRSRSIENDNVDVRPDCEYTANGADVTNFWRAQSQLPFFARKMNKYIWRNNSVRFFIATDDVKVLRKLQTSFRHHVSYLPRACDDRGPDCVRFALADLMCLARTPTILGSPWSSFTEIVSRVGGSKVYLSGVNFGRPRVVVVLESIWRAVSRWWRTPDPKKPFYKCENAHRQG